MKRVSALWQASPRKVVGALFILMLAAMMAVASGASFTSTTPNVGNVVAAGVMQIDTDKTGGAILDVHGHVPGHSDHGTLQHTNSGDAAGVLTLSKDHVLNTGAPLSSKIDLVITDAQSGDEIYRGKLGSMGNRPAGTIAKGGTRSFDFEVTFPDADFGQGTSGSDNAYQGSRTSVDFAWDAVSQ